MADPDYDPWNEIPNEEKVQNCFSLSIKMLIFLPVFGVLLYFLKRPIINAGYLSEESAQQIVGGYFITSTFLVVSIIFILLYLRRQLKKEAEKEKEE